MNEIQTSKLKTIKLYMAVMLVGLGFFAIFGSTGVSAACSPNKLSDCTKAAACEKAGGIVQQQSQTPSGVINCVAKNNPSVCNSTNVEGCTTAKACEDAGGVSKTGTGVAAGVFYCTAKDASTGGGAGSVQKCGKDGKKGGSFFGLPTWYKYLKVDSNCEIKDFSLLGSAGKPSSLPLILLALIEIVLRIGSLVAVAFVIIGGIKFVMSQGEPDGVKDARNTILNALIGLVITVTATPVVSFLGNRFG